MNINSVSNSFFNAPQFHEIVSRSSRGSVGARLLVHHLNRAAANVPPLSEEMQQNLYFLRHQVGVTTPRSLVDGAIDALSYTRDELRSLRQLVAYSQGENIPADDMLYMYQEMGERLSHIENIPNVMSLGGSQFLTQVGNAIRESLYETANIVADTLQSAIDDGRRFTTQEMESMFGAISGAITSLFGVAQGLEEQVERPSPHMITIRTHNGGRNLTSDLIANVLETESRQLLVENLLETLAGELEQFAQTRETDENRMENRMLV